MINTYIASLIRYALNAGLIEECDKIYITNQLLDVLGLYTYEETSAKEMPLEEILQGILTYAVEAGICADDITSRD